MALTQAEQLGSEGTEESVAEAPSKAPGRGRVGRIGSLVAAMTLAVAACAPKGLDLNPQDGEVVHYQAGRDGQNIDERAVALPRAVSELFSQMGVVPLSHDLIGCNEDSGACVACSPAIRGEAGQSLNRAHTLLAGSMRQKHGLDPGEYFTHGIAATVERAFSCVKGVPIHGRGRGNQFPANPAFRGNKYQR